MDTGKLDNAIIHALQGNGILFLGAGIGNECENKFGKPLPNGGELAKIIAEALGRNDGAPELSRIAQFFRRKKGAYALKELLEEHLTVTKVSPRLNELLQMPWRRIYTTNYDNLLEINRPRFQNFTHTQQPVALSNGSHVHINGSLKSATIQNLDTELVLTDWSYANSSFPDSKWANVFRRDIGNSAAVLFIGYSMRDLDITRILISDTDIKNKIVIITKDGTDEIDLEILSEYGEIYPTGFELVAARRKQVAKNHVFQSDRYIFSSLKKLDFSSQNNYENDGLVRALYEQFIYGKIDPEFLSYKGEDIDPIISREALRDSERLIDEGRLSDVILIGGIGSGKTFSALELSRNLAGRGYTVFQTSNRRNIFDDIENFSKIDRAVIIFDN